MMKPNNMGPESTLSNVTVNLEILSNKITRTLLDLGLTGDEAKVMVFLNKKGAMKAADMAKDTGIPRTHLYTVLEGLEKKGLIFSTLERPAKFRALPLERATDFLIDSYKQKLCSMENVKKVISYDWSVLQECEVVKNSEEELVEGNLQTISGEEQIYSKTKSMMKGGVRKVEVYANGNNLARISDTDVTIKLQQMASIGTEVNILTDNPTSKISMMKEKGFEIRGIPPHFNEKIHFILVDDKELLLFNLDKVGEPSAMWTNSRSLVAAMTFLFQMGWGYVSE